MIKENSIEFFFAILFLSSYVQGTDKLVQSDLRYNPDGVLNSKRNRLHI